MSMLPQFVPRQVAFRLFRLAAVSLSLSSQASSVTYGNEAGETGMSFEFSDDIARMSASEDSKFRPVSVSKKAVPQSRFELPAEPMKVGFDFSDSVWPD